MGQEGGQHGVGVQYSLGGGMQDGSQTIPVVLNFPRLLGRDVLVYIAHQGHGLDQGGLLTMMLNQRSHGIEGLQAAVQQGIVLLGQPVLLDVGMLPKSLLSRLATRLTRLPHDAASSSLLCRTNSAQVKSESEVSGPAMEM